MNGADCKYCIGIIQQQQHLTSIGGFVLIWLISIWLKFITPPPPPSTGFIRESVDSANDNAEPLVLAVSALEHVLGEMRPRPSIAANSLSWSNLVNFPGVENMDNVIINDDDDGDDDGRGKE